MCVSRERKPSSMKLRYYESPWQQINKEQRLHFIPVDRGIWTRVSMGCDFYLKNGTFNQLGPLCQRYTWVRIWYKIYNLFILSVIVLYSIWFIFFYWMKLKSSFCHLIIKSNNSGVIWHKEKVCDWRYGETETQFSDGHVIFVTQIAIDNPPASQSLLNKNCFCSSLRPLHFLSNSGKFKPDFS